MCCRKESRHMSDRREHLRSTIAWDVIRATTIATPGSSTPAAVVARRISVTLTEIRWVAEDVADNICHGEGALGKDGVDLGG